MLALFTAAAAAITQTLGEREPATYAVAGVSPVITTRAIVERGIQTPLFGAESGVTERGTRITVPTADFTSHTPARNDTITVGAETWRVLAIEQDDGYLIRLKVVKM